MATTTITQGIEEYESAVEFKDGIDVTGTMAVSGAATFDSQSQVSRGNVLAQVTGYTSGTVLTAAQSGAIVFFNTLCNCSCSHIILSFFFLIYTIYLLYMHSLTNTTNPYLYCESINAFIVT